MAAHRKVEKWKILPLSICLLVGFGIPQNPPELTTGSPASVAEKLRHHNVPLTIPGLVSALQSEDPEVRFLAASQLAFSEQAKEVIPDIRAALTRENNPLARINIAYALAQLEQQDGFQALRIACFDDKIVAHLRLFAASYLLDLHRDDCLPGVLDILQNDSNAADKMQALSLLPRFKQPSQENRERLTTLVLTALQDPTPAVRISAGDVLSRVGVKTDQQYLRAAVDREQDDVVRSQLQSDLERIVKKYKQE